MAKANILPVKNNTSAVLKANTVVYINGYDDNEENPTPSVNLASNDDESRMPAVGLVDDDINAGERGNVRVVGLISGLDTSNYEPNTLVYVGKEGGLLFTRPSDPTEITQLLGVVVSKEEGQLGQLYLFSPSNHIKHAQAHKIGGYDEFPHASQHEVDGGDEILHSKISGLDVDDHKQYILVDGSRAFTGAVEGIDPTSAQQLATRNYIDTLGIRLVGNDLTLGQGTNNFITIGNTGGVQIGSPAGGDKGAGTINATALYAVDNVNATTINATTLNATNVNGTTLSSNNAGGVGITCIGAFRLTPSARPSSGLVGDMYMDVSGYLTVCILPGTPGDWARVVDYLTV